MRTLASHERDIIKQKSHNPLPDVLAHEASVEIGANEVLYRCQQSVQTRNLEGGRTHIDKLPGLALVVGATGLVLEDDVVVPAPLDGEVGLVEERVAQCNVALALLLLGLCALLFFLLALLLALAPDALQLTLQLGVLVVAIAIAIIIVVLIVIFVIVVVGIEGPRLG